MSDAILPPIRPGRKVLVIGDSHTVTNYGPRLDELCRQSGAIVRTYGSCGSHPIWWFDGTRTHCGYYENNELGQVTRIRFSLLKRTPLLRTLLAQFQPEVVIVSLGANMVDYAESVVVETTQKMARTIRQSGAELFWVGPPVVRLQPRWKLNRLYRFLQKALTPECQCFIDSRPLTHYPEVGGDGIHYTGKEGRAIAHRWAEAVFVQLQAASGPSQELATALNENEALMFPSPSDQARSDILS